MVTRLDVKRGCALMYLSKKGRVHAAPSPPAIALRTLQNPNWVLNTMYSATTPLTTSVRYPLCLQHSRHTYIDCHGRLPWNHDIDVNVDSSALSAEGGFRCCATLHFQGGMGAESLNPRPSKWGSRAPGAVVRRSVGPGPGDAEQHRQQGGHGQEVRRRRVAGQRVRLQEAQEGENDDRQRRAHHVHLRARRNPVRVLGWRWGGNPSGREPLAVSTVMLTT